MYRLTFCLILLPVFTLYAQRPESAPVMFWNHYTFFNPAASGMFYKHAATATVQAFFTSGYESPQSGWAGYDVKDNNLHGGMGVNYSIQKQRGQTIQKARLNYSYHVEKMEKDVLGIGISPGVDYITKNGSLEGMNPIQIYEVGTKLNIDAGIFYKKDRFHFAMSVTNILTKTTGARNFWITTGYLLDLGKGFELHPQALFRSDIGTLTWDINVLGTYLKRYWAGISYNTRSMNVKFGLPRLMGGWNIKEKFRVGYSYGPPVNSLYASHEVVVGVMLR